VPLQLGIVVDEARHDHRTSGVGSMCITRAASSQRDAGSLYDAVAQQLYAFAFGLIIDLS